MIVKLLDDHVAHRGLTRSRTSRNTYSIGGTNNQIERKKQLQRLNQMQGLNEMRIESLLFRNANKQKGVRVPMTKGCLGELASARFEESAAEERRERGEADEEEGEEERRPSSRRPEKWAPEAASIR